MPDELSVTAVAPRAGAARAGPQAMLTLLSAAAARRLRADPAGRRQQRFAEHRQPEGSFRG